ncbi:hypothetical protein LXL04_031010 [Taraxacum kok-saghyz]
MGSILEFMKPICLFAKRNKNNKHKKKKEGVHRDEKKEQLLKNNQLTLHECILNSPNIYKSSPLLSSSSSKRVYPNPPFVNENVSMETVLLGDCWNPLFENDDDVAGIKGTKKRVSFRTPEVADIFILSTSPESPHRQALM